MRDPRKLWQAWQLSQAQRTTASDLYAISDPIAAFCFNRAVTLWGRAIENDLTEKTQDAKNKKQAEMKAQVVMNRWLYVDGESSHGRFADPAKMIRT